MLKENVYEEITNFPVEKDIPQKEGPDIISSTKDPVTIHLVVTDTDGSVVMHEYVGGDILLNILSQYSIEHQELLRLVQHFINPIGKCCYSTKSREFVNSIIGVLVLYSASLKFDQSLSMLDSDCCDTFNFIVTY